jgi:hypothetical protein
VSILHRVIAAALAATVFSSSSSFAQFATTVVSFNPGPSANPAFPASNTLGGPRGGGLTGGSSHVCVLGVGGSITLGFANPLRNGPGADFLAFENGFTFSGGVFSEVAAVEVSSDGVNFARFPLRYAGPAAPQAAFGSMPMGTFSGMVGGMPVLANVTTNTIDPRDPVIAGGEAFDLADLASEPTVVAGLVDLDSVVEVRIVDLQEGTVQDTSGAFVYDNGGASGSADIDAVAVVHDSSTASPNAPVCDLYVDSSGFLHLEVGDLNGFFNLDLATLNASYDLQVFPLVQVLPAFVLTSYDGKVAHFVTGPIPSSGLLGAFAASVKDKQGAFAGDQVMIQG